MTHQDFYVYEHWRPDTGKCFYVGKGRKHRAYAMHTRNDYHKRIVNLLTTKQLVLEVRLISTGMFSDEASALEVLRIKFWHRRGVVLANLTNGGDGRSGYKMSDESKAKISRGHAGKPKSKAQRIKMSEAHKRLYAAGAVKPHWGRPLSPEHRAKLCLGQQARHARNRRAKLLAAEGLRRFEEEHSGAPKLLVN